MGYRSSNVAKKLLQAQVEEKGGKDPSTPLDVFNLTGGVFQWACEGRELINEKGERVSTVHPFNSFWGKLLPSNFIHKI